MRTGLRGAVGVAIVSAGLLLAGVVTGQAGAATAQSSVNVVVIPGFVAPHYSGFIGVPNFPTGGPGLANYHFSQLASGAVTPAALQGFDTVVLYGVRWATLPTSAQAAINAFAQTGKVVIWDADATGSQDYSSFAQPFTTTASAEVKSPTTPGGVVTFPTGADPLASPDPSNPLFLDPNALTANNDLIEDMSVINPASARDWLPALIAANQIITQGGWVLAWAYGSTADQTGMTIYSGMDADAFAEPATPNYALKELAIELATPFQRSPVTGCAPNCSPPPPPTGGATGSTGATGGSALSGIGNPGSQTFALCSFARHPPRSWVHHRVSLFLTTSFAAGISGRVLAPTGKVLATGVPTTAGDLRFAVKTTRLPSNRRSKLRVVVYVNSAQACSVSTHLKVDNTPPKLLLLKQRTSGGRRLLTLRSNEAGQLSIRSATRTLRTMHVRARTTVTVTLPSGQKRETLVLVDRAGNRITHSLG